MKKYHEFEEIKNDFQEVNDEFTVFVVEQKYYLHRGHPYLSQFINKENWISTDRKMNTLLNKIVSWVFKKIPILSDLIESLSKAQAQNPLALAEIIINLSKLFAPTLHRAAGPNVVDPIIIEEGKVSAKSIAQMVTLHNGCNYRPSIIIILQDNDFDRAKKLLSKCPNNTNIKMISNNGEEIFCKVINDGATNVEEFLDYYSRQCFSTCSKTSLNVLLSEDWANNTIINRFSPTIFKIRSTFLNEHKLDAVNDIMWLETQLDTFTPKGIENQKILESFSCMNKLFQVYCNDFGGKQLNDAYQIAKDLDSDILKAHVYRYSHFFECSRQEKQTLLLKAENIFYDYNVSDHAIYCNNNRLIHQFSQNAIKINDFNLLEGKATHDTPGLALMAHIINNVGVAYMFEMFLSDAIDKFTYGLQFAKNDHIQQLALKSNRLCAKCLAFIETDEKEVRQILNEIFTPSLGFKRLPFLTAQFALNVLAVVIRTKPMLYQELLNDYKIVKLIQTAFDTNIMGTGSMIKQMQILSIKYPIFKILDELKLPTQTTDVSGLRLDFICQHGINPFFFNAWL